jgi:membrane-associated phospholipid phosphatase
MSRLDRTHAERGRLVLFWVFAAYAGVIVVLASLGLYVFFLKTLVLPGLVLVAVLSRRPLAFVHDWVLFLAQLLLFDSLRGYIYAVVTAFNWPVYMGYAIRWEEALFGGVTLPSLLQSQWHEASRIGFLERLLVIIHGSHFLFFLLLGLVLWYLRPQDFGRYTTGLCILMYAGLVGYVVVPTVPPWMAAQPFHVLPPIHRIAPLVYNVAVPSLLRGLDTNPIAAMPSLHAAFPTLACLVAARHFARARLALVVYLLLVFLAIVYLGEHYFVDVLAGAALAGAVYYLAYHTSIPARIRARLSRRPAPSAERDGEVHLLVGRARVGVALALLLLSQGIGYVSRRIREPFLPTRAFVERELSNKSDVAHFYLGRAAMRDRDYGAAQTAFAQAVTEVRSVDMRIRAQELLGWNAFHNGDYPAASRALKELPPERLDDTGRLMLGIAQLRSGRPAEGYRVLNDLVSRLPSNPVPLYWLTRHRFMDRQITRAQVKDVILRLRRSEHSQAAQLAQDLEMLLAGSSSGGSP